MNILQLPFDIQQKFIKGINKFSITDPQNKNLMFILINYAYNSRKIYTIDCLAAAVFDCIWENCYKDLNELYVEKEAQFKREIEVHEKRIAEETKKLEEVEQKIKAEEQANPGQKKDDKKAAKKGGKGETVASSPLQQQKMDVEKSLSTSKTAITKYNQKITQLGDLKTKLEETKGKIQREQVYIELVDKTGERKFIKNKLKMQANEFLTDRGIYYLCTVAAQGEEEEVEALTHEGFAVRTYEEDLQVPADEVVFSVKKEDKGKKGGKKK